MAISSLSDIKQYLKIDVAETAQDTFLTDLLNKATNDINTYCRQPFELTDITIILTGILAFYDASKAILPYDVVNSIASLKYRETPLDDYITIASDEYKLIKMGTLNIVYYYNGFTPTYQYEIALNVGYSSIPEEINQVCIEKTAIMFFESKQGGGRLGLTNLNESKSGFTGSTTYNDMRDRHNLILDKYKRAIL